jgi:predicted RNA binding protein YcfA (HicA-like mRNA interferase family)
MGNQKLPILSGREICKALGKDGFQMVSQKGSHIKLKKRLKSGKVLVTTVPDHKHISRHLLKTILNQAGLNRERFLKLIK